MFFFHLIAAIVITLWGVEESPVLIKELRDVFLDLVYGWDVDPRKSRILRQIQEYVSNHHFKWKLVFSHNGKYNNDLNHNISMQKGWMLWRKRIRRLHRCSQTSSFWMSRLGNWVRIPVWVPTTVCMVARAMDWISSWCIRNHDASRCFWYLGKSKAAKPLTTIQQRTISILNISWAEPHFLLLSNHW